MGKTPDLANLPINEFYEVLGQQLESSSALIATAFELINTVSKRLDDIETRLAALEKRDRT